MGGAHARALRGHPARRAHRARPLHVSPLRVGGLAPELPLGPAMPGLRHGPQAGRLRPPQGKEGRRLALRHARDWERWQDSAFPERLRREAAARPERPLFSDAGAMLLRGRRMNPLRRVRTGTLILYPARIELATILGERLRFSPSSRSKALECSSATPWNTTSAGSFSRSDFPCDPPRPASGRRPSRRSRAPVCGPALSNRAVQAQSGLFQPPAGIP